MKKKRHWASQARQYLQEVSVAVFMLVTVGIFVISAAVTLTLVWLYTRD